MGHERVVGAELAVLEERHREGFGQQGQGQGAGQHQQEAQAQAPVEQLRVGMAVVAGVGLGQGRQQDGAQGHAQHAGRQLHQAIGVIHPGHRARHQEGGEDGVEDQRNLPHGNPEDGRPHLFQHPPDPHIVQIQPRQHEHADALQRRQLVEQLGQAAGQHRPAECHDRRVEIGNQEQREHDHADVQQGRHEGRHRITVPGIEDGARQGRQRDQEDIGEGHPQQVGGQRELLGVLGEPRRGHPDHPGRGQDAQQGHQRQHQGQQARHIGDEGPGRLLALLGLVLGQDGDEGLGEGTFGEDAAQQVGQLERDEEGVGRHAGAEVARDYGVADESQHAGKHGDGADGRQRLEQVHRGVRTGIARSPAKLYVPGGQGCRV
ncbi:hypothetical protein D3C78_932170 [compost metagenome]